MIDADQALHHAEVFADQLQTRGDARGELLSLELAAHRASTSAEARRLHREAQRIRDAHEALVWPAPLHDSYVQMRAGFVLRGGCDELFAADVPIELAVSVRETWTTQRRLEEVLPGLIEARRRGLALDQLRHVSPPRAAASLAQLPTLAAHEGRRLAIRALQLDGSASCSASNAFAGINPWTPSSCGRWPSSGSSRCTSAPSSSIPPSSPCSARACRPSTCTASPARSRRSSRCPGCAR